jgi:hypothetical protein
MDTTCFALRIPERFPMERSDGARLCGAVGKRAGAASDLIGAQSLTETKGECARDTLSRVCRKVSAVALPATAPAIRRKRFLAIDASRCGAPVSYSSGGPTAIEVYQK